eukprot:Sspe_Gene.59856::Locus_32923_Transcript_1_1_Confidence_1.000_Length_1945::g.59856::m.59856
MSFDLHDAARRGDVAHMQCILASRSISPNHLEQRTKATALHYAVLEQHVEAVQLLMEFRADPNVPDKDAKLPIHNAITKQSDPSVSLLLLQILLENGADPTLRMKDGETVLHQAAREGHLEAVKYLLEERGGELEVDCRNDRDETPLFFAAGNSHSSVVLELLDRGANPNIPNMKGRTPLHMALRWAKSDTKKRIERAAASAPAVEHITLASGLVIRKDLLPSSFEEVREKVQAQREYRERSMSPEPVIPREAARADGHVDFSFAGQVHAMGHADQHRRSSPVMRTESMMSSPNRPLSADDIASESATESRLHGTNEVQRQRELERMVDKERMRVDQRLRGLFYADLQRRKRESRRLREQQKSSDQPAVVTKTTQKEEELERLCAEIRSLKEAGFKDPSKEMRRLERETKRKQRAERKEQREREREAEDLHSDEDNVEEAGEMAAELLGNEVIPAHEGFTLRRVAAGVHHYSTAKSGLYGMINALELRLKHVGNSCADLDRRCEQLIEIQKTLQQEMRTGRGRRYGHRASVYSTQGTQPVHEVSTLSKKDQKALGELDQRLGVLEKRVKREIRRQRQLEDEAGETSVFFWWLLRVLFIVAQVAYFWAHRAVMYFSPPPLWI